jgi:hypothetical protein
LIELDDVYSDEATKDTLLDFWKGAAGFLSRTAATPIADIDAMRSIASNFSDIPERAVKRRPELMHAARLAFETLAQVNDLAILPGWLRTHMFAHGLFSLEKKGGEFWFGEDETLEWVSKLCGLWKQQFLREDLLSEAWDLHFAYAILQSGGWDGECKQRLTSLIRDDRTFDSLVVMMFGGIHATARSAIEQLCDYETLPASSPDACA